MKSWYVITEQRRIKCLFVSISAPGNMIVLNCNGTHVKFRFKDFYSEYSSAKEGNDTVVYALSPSDKNKVKPVKIVFK